MNPLRIEVGPAAVVIEWDDDSVSEIPATELRRRCPCAECKERPSTGEGVTVSDARLVGSYGIAFTFSDGHSAGIYAFGSLRD